MLWLGLKKTKNNVTKKAEWDGLITPEELEHYKFLCRQDYEYGGPHAEYWAFGEKMARKYGFTFNSGPTLNTNTGYYEYQTQRDKVFDTIHKWGPVDQGDIEEYVKIKKHNDEKVRYIEKYKEYLKELQKKYNMRDKESYVVSLDVKTGKLSYHESSGSGCPWG